MKHTFKAQKEYQKLTEFISEELAFLPISTIRSQMRQGEVRINGKVAEKEQPVQKDDEVKIFLPERFEPKTVMPEIVYADQNIAVVRKPVLCETETHLTNLMRTVYPMCVPAHRLDRNTGGLVIFSLNEMAEKEILCLFKDRKIEKYYRAEVYGTVKPSAQTVTLYLKKDAELGRVSVSDTQKAGYLSATLSYTTILQCGGNTVLDICLHTGRTHQIRAVMAHLGYPVIGDGKYGSEKINRIQKVKYQRLLAYKICFSAMSGSGILNYLSGTKIELKNIDLI